MSTATFVINRQPKVLHLEAWAYDRGNARFGRPVALCGADRGADWTKGWHSTGEWDDSDKWARHRTLPLCSKCRSLLDRLNLSASVLAAPSVLVDPLTPEDPQP